MSSVEEGFKSGFDRNANIAMEENLQSILELYEDKVSNNPENYSDFIQDVQEGFQHQTGIENNCSIENDVYAQTFVKMARDYLDEQMDLDPTYESKVRSVRDELLSDSQTNEKKAAEIGLEIDRRYNVEGEAYSADEGYEEKEDGAVIID